MTAGLKLLAVLTLLLISACVSTGTKAITDAGFVSQIEVGKSTQTDVAAVKHYRELMDRHKPKPPTVTVDEYQPVEYGFTSLEGYLAARLVVEVLPSGRRWVGITHPDDLDDARLALADHLPGPTQEATAP